ncbi:MAG: glycosyltransferase [Candidatus Omnitrophica bacterium]|nr:glycosyltransferase [Candidatus Omnitrophota bacterium]
MGNSSSSSSSETLLIIPTYNEAGNIEPLIREIHEQGLGLDLLIIDDCSPDGTGDVAERLSREIPLRVIHRERKGGIGSAQKLGFRHAIEHRYRYAITMDGDFAHSPRYLRDLLAGAAAGADVVVGSRYIRGGGLSGWGIHRVILTRAAHWLTRHLLELPYDMTGGFRLYRVSVLAAVDLDAVRSDGYAFLTEILFRIARAGFSIREIPIVIPSRHLGRSKISRVEILRAARTLFRLALQRTGSRG